MYYSQQGTGEAIGQESKRYVGVFPTKVKYNPPLRQQEMLRIKISEKGKRNDLKAPFLAHVFLKFSNH